MILCLEGDEVGKVRDLYFLSIKLQNGIKNHFVFEVAPYDTNLLFPPYRHDSVAKTSAGQKKSYL